MVTQADGDLAAGAAALAAGPPVPHVLGTAHGVSEVRGRGLHPRLLRNVQWHRKGEVLMDAPAALMVFLAVTFCLFAVILHYMVCV